MIASLFQTAARLNNGAVLLLQSGDYRKGVETLAQSIKVMKQLLTSSETNVKESQSSSSTISFRGELVTQDQQDNLVFNQAFQIPEDNEEAVRDVRVHTAAVIFNLALAHHIRHTVGDLQHRRACLAKAEKLYLMTLKMLHSRNCQNSQTGLIVTLACINNLSQIGFDADGSFYGMAREALLRFSMIASTNGASTNTVSSGQPLIQGLLLNVMFLKAPKVAPAA